MLFIEDLVALAVSGGRLAFGWQGDSNGSSFARCNLKRYSLIRGL